MTNIKRLYLLCIGVFLFFTAMPSQAVLITVNMDGVISNFDPGGLFNSSFQIGQTINMSYTFETDTPQTPFSAADPNHGRFENGHTMSVSIPAGGFNWEFGSCSLCSIGIFNNFDQGGGLSEDQISIASINPISVTPVQGNTPTSWNSVLDKRLTLLKLRIC